MCILRLWLLSCAAAAATATLCGGVPRKVDYAIVTMVGGDAKYILGANVLAHSLFASLDSHVLRHTKFIAFVDEHSGALTAMLSPAWTVCLLPRVGNVMLLKLSVWQLTGFRRVLFLDADSMSVGDVSPLLTQHDMEDIAVTPDWFDAPLTEGSNPGFNTGVFSVRPSMETYFRLHAFRLASNREHSEQTLINDYYKGTTNFTWFPYSYNAWLNGLADGPETKARGQWDTMYDSMKPLRHLHLIGHVPPSRCDT